MFAPDTIKLIAAKRIFTGVEFEEVYLGDKRVGFKAKHGNARYEDESITVICTQLWDANATNKTIETAIAVGEQK